jgi:hypothetical protein
MSDHPRISTSQQLTAAVIEQQHNIQGLAITQPNTLSESTIAQAIDPLPTDSGETSMEQTGTSVIPSMSLIQSEAVQ